MYSLMMSERLENLLGALAVAVSDAVSEAVQTASGHAGAIGAAMAVLAQEPGLNIEQLKVPLGRTQSATVRIVNQLVADGYAERRAGPDGRTVAVFLTAAGQTAAAAVLDRRAEVLREILAGLPAARRDDLEDTVSVLLTSLTRGVADAERICRLCDVAACPPSRCPVDQAADYGPGRSGRPVPRPARAPHPARGSGLADGSGPADSSRPARGSGLADGSGPADSSRPARGSGLADGSGPADSSRPARGSGLADGSGPADSSGPARGSGPADGSRPADGSQAGQSGDGTAECRC
jgi:MarR family transcriptional repressor of emrRAB